MLDTAVIGAGPFGLSIAAHLKGCGVDFQIFGSPMHTWLEQMPRGMRLKSEGFASTLYDPDSAFTLRNYCRERNLPYAEIGLPVPLETFSSYGLEFQKRLLPELQNQNVTSLSREGSGFRLELNNGKTLVARKAVVAVGLTHFQYVPPALASLPRDLLTHSSQHRTLDRFRGREVAVIGAGASAADTAVLLHDAGASVQMIARRPAIAFHDPPPSGKPSLWRSMRWPVTGLGPGWKLVFYAKAPLLFRHLPESVRHAKVREVLGPAPGWFVRDEVERHVRVTTGVQIDHAVVRNGRVHLELSDGAGSRRTVIADHVIAATGYRADLNRLPFLSRKTIAELQSSGSTPVLSSCFESSIPGLYFVGMLSANTFGPLVRFAYGAGFTARRLSRHLARTRNSAEKAFEAPTGQADPDPAGAALR